MNEYIELLAKIKDAVILPTITDGFIETTGSRILTGVFVMLISFTVLVLLSNMSKISKFFYFVNNVSVWVFIVSTIATVTMTIGMVLYLALIPNDFSKDSKLAISNYVVEMDEQEYSRLEKLVKLYGNNLSSNDKTIKQINKHLLETIGK